MAAGDPDPERARPDDKLKRRGELDRLAVYSGVHRRGSTHLETRRGPGSTRALASTRGGEDDDPELPAVERWPGAGRTRRVERVGVVRHEHDGGVAMRAAAVVHELEIDCGRTRPEHFRRRLQQRARLGVAVGRLPNRVSVDPERRVVEKDAAVYFRRVDPALDAVGERIERAEQVAAINA